MTHLASYPGTIPEKNLFFTKGDRYESRKKKEGAMKNRAGGEKAPGYIRHSVAADGDCGYTAFGITRDDAFSQLLTHLEPVKELLQPAIREALLTDQFYRHLIANNVITSHVTHETIIQHLEEHLSLTAVYRSYLTYDIRDKQIDAGCAHPGVLQALAHIRGVSLRMWRLGDNAELCPNREAGFDYFEYISPNGEDPRPVDILFVNNNHFELLESSELNERVSEGDMPTYPLNSSSTQKERENSSSTGGGGVKPDGVRQHTEKVMLSEPISVTTALKSAYSNEKFSGIEVPFKDKRLSYDEMYVSLQLRGTSDRKQDSEITFKMLADTQDSSTGLAIRHTWIEGAAGMGKTTLCRRMMYQWATGKIWQQYKVVLYLPLRHIIPLFDQQDRAYTIHDFMEQAHAWDHYVLMGNPTADRKNLIGKNEQKQLEELMVHHPDQVLLVLDGLDEVDINHVLLTNTLMDTDKGHHWVVTTRPQKIPDNLNIDRHVINHGFNEQARFNYVDKYYRRFALDDAENAASKKAALLGWMERQKHMDAFMAIPLNCHLICSASTTGDLTNSLTSTELYDLLLIKWIKVALSKSASMRKTYGLEGETAVQISQSIDEANNNELLASSASWISNLEAISYRCIKTGDQIVVSGQGMKAVIKEQHKEGNVEACYQQKRRVWSDNHDAISYEKKQTLRANANTEYQALSDSLVRDRIGELLCFGLFKKQAFSNDLLQDKYEYNHKTFLEYMAGRYIAKYFTGRPSAQTKTSEINTWLSDSTVGGCFYQPRLSLVLRFASGTLNKQACDGKRQASHLRRWVQTLTQSYLRAYWGSGPLLHMFACLLEINQEWPTESNQSSAEGGGGASKEELPAPIVSIKIIMMSMLWAYVQTHTVMGDAHAFDGTLARLWCSGYLQIQSIDSPEHDELKRAITEDSEQTEQLILQQQAKKALNLMGGELGKNFEREQKPTDLGSTPELLEGEWLETCLKSRDDLTGWFRQLSSENNEVRNIAAYALSNLAPFIADLPPDLKKDVLQPLIAQLSDKNSDVRDVAFSALHSLAPFISDLPPNLKNDVLQAFIAQLSDEKSLVRVVAISALGKLAPLIPDLPPDMKRDLLQAVIAQFSDERLCVRKHAVSALDKLAPFMPDLPPDMKRDLLQPVITQLSDKNCELKYVALSALTKLAPLMPSLPADLKKYVLQAVISQLSGEGFYVKKYAFSALGELAPLIPDLPPDRKKDLLQAVIAQLSVKNSVVSVVAISALTKLVVFMPDLPPDMKRDLLQAIIAQLSDNNSDLGDGDNILTPFIADFSPDMKRDLLQAVIAQLSGEDFKVRRTAVFVLNKLAPLIPDLPPDMKRDLLQPLITQLSDKNIYVREVAISALGDLALLIPDLPPDMKRDLLKSVIAQLSHERYWVRDLAVSALDKLAPLMPNLPPDMKRDLLQALIAQLSDEDLNVRVVAISALDKLAPLIADFSTERKKDLLQAFIAQLSDNNFKVRKAAVSALNKLAPLMPDLPPDMKRDLLQAVIAQLSDEDLNVRVVPVSVLDKLSPLMPDLPPDMKRDLLQAVIAQLSDEDLNVRVVAVSVLNKLSPLMPDLPPDMKRDLLQPVIAQLSNNNRDLRVFAVSALDKLAPLMPDLPPDMKRDLLQAVIAQLSDEKLWVREDAVSALDKLAPLMPDLSLNMKRDLLQPVIAQLSDEDLDVRVVAISALDKLASLIADFSTETKKDVLQAFIAQLSDEKSVVRVVAISALGKLAPLIPDLPSDIKRDLLQALIVQFSDERLCVRKHAVSALDKLAPFMPALPPDMKRDLLQPVITQLSDKNCQLKYVALFALTKLAPLIPDLPPDMKRDLLQALIAQASDENSYVKKHAISALGKLAPLIPDLPPDMKRDLLQVFIAQLSDTDFKVRETAVSALGKLSPFIADFSPDMKRNLMQPVIAQVSDINFKVREAAVSALGKLSPFITDFFPDMKRDLLQAFIAQIPDERFWIRKHAISALGKLAPFIADLPPDLKKDVLQALISQLSDKNSDVRDLAFSALHNLAPFMPDLPLDLKKYVMQAFIAQLSDKAFKVREAAVSAQGKLSPFIADLCPNMKKDVLQAFISQLPDKDFKVREAAVSALGKLTPFIADLSLDMKKDVLQALFAEHPFDESLSNSLYTFKKTLFDSFSYYDLQKDHSLKQTQKSIELLIEDRQRLQNPEIKLRVLLTLVNYRSYLLTQLNIRTLMHCSFDQAMAPTVIQHLFMGWHLPRVISGRQCNQYQCIGADPMDAPSASQYREAFHQLKPSKVKDGLRMIQSLFSAPRSQQARGRDSTTQGERIVNIIGGTVRMTADDAAISFLRCELNGIIDHAYLILERLGADDTIDIRQAELTYNENTGKVIIHWGPVTKKILKGLNNKPCQTWGITRGEYDTAEALIKEDIKKADRRDLKFQVHGANRSQNERDVIIEHNCLTWGYRILDAIHASLRENAGQRQYVFLNNPKLAIRRLAQPNQGTATKGPCCII